MPSSNDVTQTNKRTAVMYRGPIPPSSELANYEKIQPGLAQLIVKMAENEQSHRHIQEAKLLDMDNKELTAKIKETFLGQLFAFLGLIITVSAGVYTAVHGAPIPGSIFGTMGVGAILYAFIKGRK